MNSALLRKVADALHTDIDVAVAELYSLDDLLFCVSSGNTTPEAIPGAVAGARQDLTAVRLNLIGIREWLDALKQEP